MQDPNFTDKGDRVTGMFRGYSVSIWLQNLGGYVITIRKDDIKVYQKVGFLGSSDGAVSHAKRMINKIQNPPAKPAKVVRRYRTGTFMEWFME